MEDGSLIKYKTSACTYEMKLEIIPVKVERETEHSVWINGDRAAKQTSWEIYHDSWQQARDFLMEQIENKLEYHQEYLEAMELKKQKLMTMQEGDEQPKAG